MSAPAARRLPRIQTPSWLVPLVLVVGGLIAVLAVISLVGILHAIRLEHRIDSLPAIIQQAETNAENGRLAAADANLAAAQGTLSSVNTALYNSLDFQIMDLLPVAHQNLAAIKSSVQLGLRMVGGGEQILAAAGPLEGSDGKLEVSLVTGQVPLKTTQAVEGTIASVIADLPLSEPAGGNHFLLGRVKSAESRIYAEALKKRRQLASVGAALSVIDDISGASGDHHYLIAVSNSAEMRGSGGMYLSYGLLSSHDGKVRLTHFGDIAELHLSHPETKAAFPADFMKIYGGLGPTVDWHNVNLMSDFTVDAPVMEAMFTQATGISLDGVIQVDPSGLGALLEGVGPVQTADLGTVTASNVVPLTLNQSYFLYPNRTQRQDYTGEVAQASFSKLLSGRFPGLRGLGTALVHAAAQRHVLMYTNNQADETVLTTFGFAGQLPPPHDDFVQLTIQNVGGNKLDYYLRSSLTLTGQPLSATGARVTATVDLSNDAPAGQTSPLEVFGPYHPGGVAGQYEGIVTLYLPADSFLRSSQADGSVTTAPAAAAENGVRIVTYTVTIPAGTQSHVVLNLYIPPSSGTNRIFTYIPSPRVLATRFAQKFA